MPVTEQSQAISLANEVIQVSNALLNLLAQINVLVQTYNDSGASNVWQALGTCVQNADGSLGAADQSPTSGHPINTANYPSLSQAVSATALMSAVGFFQDYQSVLNGTAAAPEENRRQALNQLVNG